MPSEDDPRFLKPVIVTAPSIRTLSRQVCVTLINRLYGTNFDFGDVSGKTLTAAFDRSDNHGRLEARIRAIEDRFKENLRRGQSYRPVTYALQPLAGELHQGALVWELTDALEAGVS